MSFPWQRNFSLSRPSVAISSPPINFSWIAHGLLCAFANPYLPSHVNFLLKLPLGILITMSPESQPPDYLKEKVQWVPMFVMVMRAPSLAQIDQFLKIVDSAQAEGKIVGVHCFAGKGRTGVLLAAYLIKYQNFPPSEAIDVLRAYRPGSLESQEQVDAVYAFGDIYLNRNRMWNPGQGAMITANLMTAAARELWWTRLSQVSSIKKSKLSSIGNCFGKMRKGTPSPIPVPHRTSSARAPRAPPPHGEILDTPLGVNLIV
ncbi:unnamed protein product [Cyprideis torosa]|uniref:Tyrosine specific protein phosphatases domain-containing protein n=1 Tax=Cyprideis torosa TaxID=163714 RepID=A0A7R8ZQN4_9CRUS|nr:unnamed protein product [Cyprideis torosa]CAG0901809.1 unnamed protein product [Cyprideis torosa]